MTRASFGEQSCPVSCKDYEFAGDCAHIRPDARTWTNHSCEDSCKHAGNDIPATHPQPARGRAEQRLYDDDPLLQFKKQMVGDYAKIFGGYDDPEIEFVERVIDQTIAFVRERVVPEEEEIVELTAEHFYADKDAWQMMNFENTLNEGHNLARKHVLAAFEEISK